MVNNSLWVICIGMGVLHRHGGTPKTLDDLVQGKPNLTWMIIRGTPINIDIDR